MDFHPKDLPIFKTYDLKDEKDASNAVDDMVDLGFSTRKEGFKCGTCGKMLLGKQFLKRHCKVVHKE